MMIYRKTVEKGLKPAALHNAAYALLQEVLRTDWNCPEAVIEKTALGKPYIHGREDLHISISHTDGLVCCAVSKQPVGADCEHLRTVPQRVLQRVCTPLELEAIQNAPDPEMRALALWTLKESISKKRGVGMTESFQQYEILFEEHTPRCAGHTLMLERYKDFLIAAAE